MFKWLVCLWVLALPLGIAAKDEISINAVGDMMIGSMFPSETIPPQKGASAFQFSKEYLKMENPDIIIGNLEGPVTNYPTTHKRVGSGKSFAFRMPPYLMKYFQEAGFKLVTTANNHAYDFGEKGYRDTRKYLAESGITAIGNKNEIATLKLNNKLVAFIGFGWFSFTNNYNQLSESMKLIRKAKAAHDIVVISVHGGGEGEPAIHVKDQNESLFGEQRGNLFKFCRLAVDNGADLIIGHGPHVPRAMEIYKDRLIAYSLGNFATYMLFVTSGNKKNTLVLNAKLDGQGKFLSGRIIPMVQFESGPYKGLPKYDPEGKTIKLIQKLTREDFPKSPIQIKNDGTILYGQKSLKQQD